MLLYMSTLNKKIISFDTSTLNMLGANHSYISFFDIVSKYMIIKHYNPQLFSNISICKWGKYISLDVSFTTPIN